MIKKGRPSKYDNELTRKNLEQLVFLFRQEQPSGTIKISNMVRFSETMSKKDPAFPAYDKDVWGTYGREFIDKANEPLRDIYKTDDGEVFEIPNVTEILGKITDGKEGLLSHLLPLEQLLHDALARETDKNRKIVDFEKRVETLTAELKKQSELVSKYQQFVLQMSHHSYMTEYQAQYGLENQVSINATARNKDAMRELDDLGSFLGNKNNEIPAQKTESPFLSKWKEKRQK